MFQCHLCKRTGHSKDLYLSCVPVVGEIVDVKGNDVESLDSLENDLIFPIPLD